MGRTYRANPGGDGTSKSLCPVSGKVQNATREEAIEQRRQLLKKPRGRRKRVDGTVLPMTIYMCRVDQGGCGFFHVGHDITR